MTTTVTVLREQSVDERLASYGLPSESILKQALLAGHLAKVNNRSDNDAPFIPSLLQWNAIQRTLRELLVKHGWHRVNEGMYALVVNPERNIAIAVASGDEFTGLVDGLQHPTTKSPKGPRTINAVLQNAKLYHGDLFPETLPTVQPTENNGRATWLLLFNSDSGVMRAEVSRPGSISEDGHIDAWQHRIPLSEQSLDGSLDLPATPDYAPTEEIEITRKK